MTILDIINILFWVFVALGALIIIGEILQKLVNFLVDISNWTNTLRYPFFARFGLVWIFLSVAVIGLALLAGV